MTQEERKTIYEGIRWEHQFPERLTGQHAGMPRPGFRLVHEELEFEVGCCYFRSQTENRNFCLTLFDLFLDEIDGRSCRR